MEKFVYLIHKTCYCYVPEYFQKNVISEWIFSLNSTACNCCKRKLADTSSKRSFFEKLKITKILEIRLDSSCCFKTKLTLPACELVQKSLKRTSWIKLHKLWGTSWVGSEISKIFLLKGFIYNSLPFSQKMAVNIRERTLPMQFSRLVFL